MAWVVWPTFKETMCDLGLPNAIDLEDGTLEIRLYDSTWTYVKTHDFRADFSSGSNDDEVTGSNYAAKALAAINTTLSSSTVTVDATGASSDWKYSQHSSGFADAQYVVMMKKTSSAATDALLCYFDLGSTYGNVAGDLTLTVSAAGVFTLA